MTWSRAPKPGGRSLFDPASERCRRQEFARLVAPEGPGRGADPLRRLLFLLLPGAALLVTLGAAWLLLRIG
jgi:hypothetical protein